MRSLTQPIAIKKLRDSIREEVEYINLKPYSHNIISICLSMIAKQYGQDSANKAIRDFELDKKGWSEVKWMISIQK